jgi:hypothetical protein
VDLPERVVLEELLDVCYHASLMTEEGRPTIFRVAFVSRRTPVSPLRQEPALEPIMRYLLSQPSRSPWGNCGDLLQLRTLAESLLLLSRSGKALVDVSKSTV